MRVKRRTNKEINESVRGANTHNIVPEHRKKIDISKNSDSLNVDAVTEAQRKKERKLVPLHIDARTVIYVTPEHNNEEYRLRWMQKYGYGVKLKEKITEPSCGGRNKKSFNQDKAVEMLNDAFSVSDISKEVGVSTTILYNFFNRNGMHVPVGKERVAILFHKGLSVAEIASRTKLTYRTVEQHISSM